GLRYHPNDENRKEDCVCRAVAQPGPPCCRHAPTLREGESLAPRKTICAIDRTSAMMSTSTDSVAPEPVCPSTKLCLKINVPKTSLARFGPPPVIRCTIGKV